MVRSIVITGLVSLLAFSVQAQIKASDILGIWKTKEGKAHIEVVKEGDKYNGAIVWLKEPTYADGTPKVDKENPDEKLKSRKILGLKLLSNFQFDDDEWEDGEIYDAESGKTYSCVITMPDRNTLDVRGYVGVSWLGRTTTWTRVK